MADLPPIGIGKPARPQPPMDVQTPAVPAAGTFGATLVLRGAGSWKNKRTSGVRQYFDLFDTSDANDKNTKYNVRWTLLVYEFLDNDQFSNLDTLMLQLAPGECLMTLDADAAKGKPRGDVAKILGVMERRDVSVHDFKAKHFSADDLRGKIQALSGDASLAQHSLSIEQPLGTACLAALVDRFQERGKDGELEEEEGAYSLAQGTLEEHMRLDSAAAAAVTLLPDPTAPHEFGSLYNVLNRCKTKVGSRLLERWLRQPLTDKDEIERRHDVVGFFKEEAVLRGSLRDGPLKSCPDLDALKTKMQHRRAGLLEVFKLYLFSRSVDSFVETLEAYFEEADMVDEGVKALIKDKFVSGFNKLTKGFLLFQQLVEHVLDMDVLPDLVINPTYSPQLEELRTEMDEIKSQVDELHEEAREGWCDFGEKDKCLLEEDKIRGFCFRLTKANLEQKLKNRKKSVETLQVLKNGVHFTTPELRGLGRRYKELRREYEEVQSGLVEKAVETAATYIPLVEAASALVSELDVLVSFGDVAALAPIELVRPVMKEKGEGVLSVKACRHPCLEWQDDIQFIPNHYEMSSGNGASFVVVTGPNMGGKSTYIRTLGAVAVMAQVGSFVPCESAEMSVRDAVFARVGAGDSQQRGISTFMAEMLEASAIISAATKDSLIIIDELGRGTSTFDGFGLAWAISEHIVKEVQAPCLFATHFHEMTTMADQDKRVKNLHVTAEAKEDKMTMLYEVREGACLESFGIHVAAMAGFPRAVIREAKRKAATLENFEEAMERIGDAGSSRKRKIGDDAAEVEASAGRDGSGGKPKTTKLHRLVEMFKGLPVDEMTPTEAFMATRQLVDKLYVGV